MLPLRITVEDAHNLWSSGEPVTFVDSRNPKAWADTGEKLPGAIRIPLEEIESHLSELDRKSNIITYCT